MELPMRFKGLFLGVVALVAIAPAVVRAAAVGATDLAKKSTIAPAHSKRHVAPHWHAYGFLPGYRPPEQIEREDAIAAWRRGPAYWYGYPRFYHNQWNGGGFGPCWTQTPIGNVWNCGR
jgi:hypothetical protein